MNYYIMTHNPNAAFIYGNATFSPIDQGCYSNLWHEKFLSKQSQCHIQLSVEKKKIKNDIFTTNSGFVVSEKVAKIFKSEKFKASVNLVDTTIVSKGNHPIEGKFFFAEFFSWIDAIYKSKSDIELEDGKVDVIKKLSINDGTITGEDLFFLKDANLFEPVISEKLQKELVENDVQGVTFISASSFTLEP